MTKAVLEVRDLHVVIDDKEILKGIELKLEKGRIYALMGPNGSGKSTLANVLTGHPAYSVTQGSIWLNGEDITAMEPYERARKGLFLSFQYPATIPGVTISHFLRTAINNLQAEGKPLSALKFRQLIKEKMALLKMKDEFLTRYLNDGFSGGEKKRAEILQLLTLNPQVAVLDETDSGLDVDALKVVSQGINTFMSPNHVVLLITHYKRILQYVKPHEVLIMMEGKIVAQGDASLVDQLEKKGYDSIVR